MYQPVISTLGYVLSLDAKSVLMIHRNKRKKDAHLGKYNGLGGKVAPDEDIYSSMEREIKEESGIDVLEMELRGTVSWPGFGPDGLDWLGFIFLVTKFSGKVHSSHEEGDLHWIERNLIHSLPMWEGDKYFLPLVFDEDKRPFHGVMPYKEGKPVSWQYRR